MLSTLTVSVWFCVGLVPLRSGMYPESYRTYEALAAGSIPIIHNVSFARRRAGDVCLHADNYKFLKELGAPILVVSGWEELQATVQPYVEDPAKLLALQRRLHAWYPQFMAHYANLIVTHALRPLHTPEGLAPLEQI